MMKRYFSFLMLAVFVCVGFFAGIADAATEERVITETIDMDSFHYREGGFPNDIAEYVTGWEVRIQDTPALFPFEWEPRWEKLNADIDPNTSATNCLRIYVKSALDPVFSILYNSPYITLDILDEDKKLICAGFNLREGLTALLRNSDYRLINERVAKQKTRTIYFRLSVDLADTGYDDPRFQRIKLALGVEYIKSEDTSIPLTSAWKNVYQKYDDFQIEYYKIHGHPEFASGPFPN